MFHLICCSDSIFGMALDIKYEDPRPPAMFWTYMRELRKDLDTSKMNCNQTDGHPFFRTENDEEYADLHSESIRNKGRLG